MIDKNLYKKVRAWYSEWDDAKLKERIRHAGRLSPQQAWQQYVELWIFCVGAKQQDSSAQRRLKLRVLTRYYERIHKFEQWRRRRDARSS